MSVVCWRSSIHKFCIFLPSFDRDVIATSYKYLLPPWYRNNLESLVQYAWQRKVVERYRKHWLKAGGIPVSPLRRVPVTFLCPPYETADTLFSQYESGTSAHLFHNHFFDGIYYMEKLLEMDGQVITSINDQNWIVSVLDENVFLQPEISDEKAVGRNESLSAVMIRRGSGEHNILGLNGVVHHLESPLIDKSFPTKVELQDACGDKLQSYDDCFNDCDREYITFESNLAQLNRITNTVNCLFLRLRRWKH